MTTTPAGSPPLSVVLPFRDAGATFAEALDSLGAQSFENFECLLVDHGSIDSSASIARTATARDPRFRLLRAEGSFVRCLNTGLEQARGDLVARMDADDRAKPLRFERQVEALRTDASLSLVSSLVRCFPESEVRDGMRRYQTWLNQLLTPQDIRNALFIESPLPHPSVMFRRAAVEAVGRYRDDGGPEDYDLWMRLLLGGYRACKIPEVLVEWRDSPDRLTRVDARYAKARFFETKLRYFPSAVPLDRPVQIWGSGPTGRRWGRELRKRGYEILRFVDLLEVRHGRTVQGLTVEPISQIDPAAGFTLAAVGLPGAREFIVDNLAERGMRPWKDFLAVA